MIFIGKDYPIKFLILITIDISAYVESFNSLNLPPNFSFVIHELKIMLFQKALCEKEHEITTSLDILKMFDVAVTIVLINQLRGGYN